MFTCQRLLWVIKNNGESWTGEHLHEIILTQNAFSFLKNEENIIDPDEVLFVHDKQHVCERIKSNICFKTTMLSFGIMISGPVNSHDLNMAEHIRSIVKDEVEKKYCQKPDITDILKTHSKCTWQMC